MTDAIWHLTSCSAIYFSPVWDKVIKHPTSVGFWRASQSASPRDYFVVKRLEIHHTLILSIPNLNPWIFISIENMWTTTYKLA